MHGRAALKDEVAAVLELRRAAAVGTLESLAAENARLQLELQERYSAALAEVAKAQEQHHALVAESMQRLEATKAGIVTAAQVDAANAHVQETAAVRALRAMVLATAGVLQTICHPEALQALANKVAEGMSDKSLSPAAARATVGQLVALQRQYGELVAMAMESERRLLGQPTSVVEHQVKVMSTADALRQVDEYRAKLAAMEDHTAMQAVEVTAEDAEVVPALPPPTDAEVGTDGEGVTETSV